MEDYAAIIRQLLPPGRFFDVPRDSAFSRLIDGLATELNRLRDALNSFQDNFSYEKSPDIFLLLLNITHPIPNKIAAIRSLLERQGNLSRKYIEMRLSTLGFTDFEIVDPSEWDYGLVPTTRPKRVGEVYFKLTTNEIHELRAGFSAGDSLTSWGNPPFEESVRSLIPAHITPVFIYKKKENITCEDQTQLKREQTQTGGSSLEIH